MGERGGEAGPEIRARRGKGARGDDRAGARPEREGGDASSAASPWEWVLAGAGALIVLASIGFMLHDALSGPATPPKIEISVDAVVPTEMGSYVVEFSARNRGSSTAAGLVVEGELRSEAGAVEKAQITIDYVPAGSRRRAGLIFSHDPRRYALEVRPRGYDRP